MRSTPLFTLLLLLLLPGMASAQTNRTGGDGSLLPEINPQDIEIRSEFRARFPGLRRQPILGFNPKPRVYQVDPNRTPYMETPEEAVADISVTKLGRPDPPVRTILSTPNRNNVYLRGALGSFMSPDFSGYGFYEINEENLLSADVNFRSSDGHLDDQESGFRFFDLQTQYYQKTNEQWRVSVDAGILADQLYLFEPINLNSTPEKENLGGSLKATARKTQNAFTGMEASVGGSVFQSDVSVTGAPVNSGLNGMEASEQTYFASFSKYWAGKRLYETFDVAASIRGGSYSYDLAGIEENWISTKAGMEYERLLNFTTRVKGAAAIQYISDPFSETFFVVPELEVKHHLNDALSLHLNAYAKPEIQNLQFHHQQNRFIANPSLIRNSHNTGLKLEAQYQLVEGNRFYSGLQYNNVRNYAFYRRAQLTSGDFGLYNIRFANATILEFFAGANYQLLPEKLWADANLYIRNPKLQAGGVIPYEEKMGLKGAVSFKPIKELTINGWTEYIGKREAPEVSTDLKAFILLSAGAEYQINNTFGVYAKLLNLLGQKYEIWDGYEERPFQVFGGITIKF